MEYSDPRKEAKTSRLSGFALGNDVKLKVKSRACARRGLFRVPKKLAGEELADEPKIFVEAIRDIMERVCGDGQIFAKSPARRIKPSGQGP
jgi:hypothetical protein